MYDFTTIGEYLQHYMEERGEIMIAINLAPGMDIFGQDDVKLGTVKEVWAQTESHGCLPVSRFLLQDYGPVRGTSQILSMEDGYLQVRPGNSSGSNSRDLWVPLHAVSHVDTETCVTLKADASTYESYFTRQPEWLEHAA